MRVATNLESKKRIELAEGRGGVRKKKDVPTLHAYLQTQSSRGQRRNLPPFLNR